MRAAYQHQREVGIISHMLWRDCNGLLEMFLSLFRKMFMHPCAVAGAHWVLEDVPLLVQGAVHWQAWLDDEHLWQPNTACAPAGNTQVYLLALDCTHQSIHPDFQLSAAMH